MIPNQTKSKSHTHIISYWYDKYIEKKTYVEKKINQQSLPYVDFINLDIKTNNLYKYILDKYCQGPTPNDTFINKLICIRRIIGAFVSDNYDKSNHKKLFYQKEKIFESTNSIKCIKIHLSKNLMPNYKDKMMLNGWYYTATQNGLEGAIQYYKPKVIVELGVYLAKSTNGIFQTTKKLNMSVDYYGFDFFTNICTNPKNISYSPLDDFFLDYFKLDTAIANVLDYSDTNNINYLILDVTKSPEYFKERNIIPDLVFIDALKDYDQLLNTINKFIELNNNIIIIGDDYNVNDDVKDVVKQFKNSKVLGNTCYIITNREIPDSFPEHVSNFKDLPKLNLTSEQIKKIPKSMHLYIH
jgi:hypothetical protein